jgi:hypothetical protein
MVMIDFELRRYPLESNLDSWLVLNTPHTFSFSTKLKAGWGWRLLSKREKPYDFKRLQSSLYPFSTVIVRISVPWQTGKCFRFT